MIRNNKKKWIYIGPPKTGSTAVSYILTDGKYKKNYIAEDLSINFEGKEVNGQHTPWPPKKLKIKYNDHKVFISVRNPFSRIVSLYNHWKNGKNYGRELLSKNNDLNQFNGCFALISVAKALTSKRKRQNTYRHNSQNQSCVVIIRHLSIH